MILLVLPHSSVLTKENRPKKKIKAGQTAEMGQIVKKRELKAHRFQSCS
jgi:hypothetical protein